MAPPRGRSTQGNSNGYNTAGKSTMPTKPQSPPDWLSTEAIIAAKHDGDMYSKIIRHLLADQQLYDQIKYGADHLRRRLLQRKHDKIKAGLKSERDKAKDKAKAATKEVRPGGKPPRIVGDDFATATLWDDQAIK